MGVGYIAAGSIATSIGWKATFWIQAGIAAPFAAFFLLARPVDLTSKHGHCGPPTVVTSENCDDAPRGHKTPLSWWRRAFAPLVHNVRIGCGVVWLELKVVVSRPTCIAAILGLSFQAFYSSTASFWAPKVRQLRFRVCRRIFAASPRIVMIVMILRCRDCPRYLSLAHDLSSFHYSYSSQVYSITPLPQHRYQSIIFSEAF